MTAEAEDWADLIARALDADPLGDFDEIVARLVASCASTFPSDPGPTQ